MKIGLIDVDGHNFPNIPLMKISAWHKSQGDHVEWYQPMFSRSKGKVMVYILVNFNTTLEQDIYRIQLCRELNISPYPMIYDKEHCDKVYKRLQRWCNNFIFWSTPTFEEYTG